MGSDADFQAMYDFVCKYKIKPVVDSIFTLDNIHLAFDKMNLSSQIGKIVIKIS